jgi:hypothetical protein
LKVLCPLKPKKVADPNSEAEPHKFNPQFLNPKFLTAIKLNADRVNIKHHHLSSQRQNNYLELIKRQCNDDYCKSSFTSFSYEVTKASREHPSRFTEEINPTGNRGIHKETRARSRREPQSEDQKGQNKRSRLSQRI